MSFDFKKLEAHLGTMHIHDSKQSLLSSTVPKWLQKLRPSLDSPDAQIDDPKLKNGYIPQPEGLNAKLYSYQLESLTWMQKVEERVAKGTRVSAIEPYSRIAGIGWSVLKLVPWFTNSYGADSTPVTKLLFDRKKSTCCFVSSLEEEEHVANFYARGGTCACSIAYGVSSSAHQAF